MYLYILYSTVQWTSVFNSLFMFLNSECCIFKIPTSPHPTWLVRNCLYFHGFLATFAWHFCLQILVDFSSSTFSLILKEFNIGHKFSNVFKWNRNMEVLSYLLNFKYKFEAVKEFRYKPLIRVKMKMSLQSIQQFTFEDIEK